MLIDICNYVIQLFNKIRTEIDDSKYKKGRFFYNKQKHDDFHSYLSLRDNQMKRVNQLLQIQSQKPKSYQDISKNPKPYLQNANRIHIFEFIYQLEQENQRLSGILEKQYPQSTYEEIIKQATIMQINEKLIEIHQQSIEKMEVEIIDKMHKFQSVKKQNIELEKTCENLQKQFQVWQKQLIEVEKQRRSLQLQERLKKQRRQRMDISGLINNLYKEAKDILEE